MNGEVEIIDQQFKVLKPLGKGYTAEVLLAQHIESDYQLAIKIYKPTGNPKILDKNFANEVNTMRSVNNPNVVKILAGNNQGIHKRPGKIDKTIMYMGVELCQGGEFFDYIADPGKGFCDNTCRYYFNQLINGIKGIHGAGISHRDLKTENLFVDGDMNIKIGDFGFAKYIEPGNDKALLKTALGTPGYQCPELLEGDNYSGPANDIFACGVILFIMYCGFPPFREAKKFDPWYRHYFNKNPSMFWNMHTKQKRTPNISNSFKELIDGMFSTKDRFTLEDVMKSTWVNEKPVDMDQVKIDMDERKAIVLKNKQKMNDQMDVDSDNDESNEKVYRGADDQKEDLEVFMTKFKDLAFEDFELEKWNHSELVRNDYMKFKLSPKDLLSDVCSKLILKYPGVIVNFGDSYKVSVSYVPKEGNLDTVEDISQLPYELDFDFEIYEEDEAVSVVQFRKNTMNQYDFKNFFGELRSAYETEK